MLGGRFHGEATDTALRRLLARLARWQGAGRNGAINLRRPALHLRHLDIAHHHHGGVLRAVPAFVELAGIVGLQRIEVVHPAHNGPAVRRSDKLHRAQLFVQQGARRIFGAQAALFFHHFQLFAKFFVGPLVVGEAVGLEAHHVHQPAGRNLLEVAGVILAGEGVFATAQGRHTSRELSRPHAGRAFEQHVLQHMGHPRGAIDLVHGAHPQPHHVHGRGRAPVGLDDDRHAIGQGGLVNLGRGRQAPKTGRQQDWQPKGKAFHRMSHLQFLQHRTN